MLVPIDNADAYESGLQALAPDERVRYVVHDVQKRETLPMIARQYSTSVAVLAKVNDLPGGRLSPGQSLKIPQTSGQLPDKVLIAASRVDRPESGNSTRKERQIVYRVRAGETLSSIARRNNIPVSTLARLNNLATGDPLVKGQRLVLKASARRYRDEGVASGRRVLYTVHRGDTIFSIARQFQVSVEKLKSWNGINRHHQIRAGKRLVMYIDNNRQQG
jgi:membrane-bound lytic murein transglycosylase D